MTQPVALAAQTIWTGIRDEKSWARWSCFHLGRQGAHHSDAWEVRNCPSMGGQIHHACVLWGGIISRHIIVRWNTNQCQNKLPGRTWPSARARVPAMADFGWKFHAPVTKQAAAPQSTIQSPLAASRETSQLIHSTPKCYDWKFQVIQVNVQN